MPDLKDKSALIVDDHPGIVNAGIGKGLEGAKKIKCSEFGDAIIRHLG